ncbi:restriction endonuclease subunit S (plasmid) [Acinetobacter soli]|nr:restriction endonuclease subunit S [Acinetobacter soli]WEI11407.1 restriction endonuclease subunit S [Acinetobacter soli]
MGPTNLANETTAIGRGLAAIRSPSDIGFSYLLYYFKYLEPWLSQQGTGTTFKAISGEFIRNLDFLVPTEAEQQEIVRQLDIMLAQVEQIKARLDAIPAILKKFRQSVLADAVSGELINQGFNQLSVESLSDYLTDVRYGTSKKCSESLIDAVPVLRIPNIADDGTIDFTNLKYAEFESKEIKQLQLSKGDLLLIRSNGSLDLVGKSAIADELDKVVLYAGYLIRLRFNDSVNPQFIQYFLQAPQTRQTIENIARSTSGVNNINSKEIASLKIQLPCIDHQNEVVLRVKQLLELSKRIEETIKSAQKRVNFLTQSILAKAFSGELTAEWREQHQDLITGVNSAESLLAKIQAEREASKLVKKAKKVK